MTEQVAGVHRGDGGTMVRRPAAGPARALPAFAQVAGERSLRLLAWALPPVLALYALFDKGFAWVHVPGTPIFAGEVVVGMVCLVAVTATPHLRAGLSRGWSAPFLLLLIGWGAARAVPGLQTYGLDAARDSALWYYAVIVVGVCALVAAWPHLPETWARRYMRLVPWLLLWSLPALALSRLEGPIIPGSDVPVFSHRPGNIAVGAAMAMSAVWLLPSSPRIMRFRVPLLAVGALAILAVGTQNRGGLVAAAAGLAVCIALGTNRARLLGVGLVAGGLMITVAWAADVHLPGSQGRDVSVTQLIDNISSLSGTSDTSGNLAGTVAWRDQLWSSAVAATSARGQLVEGWGFGPNVALELGVPQANENPPLRSPHNSHLDVFVRMGLIGAGLWVLMWGAWYAQMLVAYRRLRDRADRHRRAILTVVLTGVTAILVNAYFDPTVESPPVALWLWTLAGVGLGVALARPSTPVTAGRGSLSLEG